MKREARTLVEIKNKEELETWLQGRERADAVAIAARAALRVLPQLTTILDEPAIDGLLLPVFRATAISWSAVRSSYWKTADSANAASSASNAFITASDAAGAAHGAARTAGTKAAKAAALRAAETITIAARNKNTEDVWAGVSADATHLDEGMPAATLIARKLWPNGLPDWAADQWTSLKANLFTATTEDWGVWTDWYEARLRGDPVNIHLDRAKAKIPNGIWEEGPKAVNAEIRRLIDEHRPTRKQLEDTVSPQPVARDGKLDVQPNEKYDTPDGSAELANLPTIQRSIIKTLIEALSSANNIAPFITTALNEYSDELLVRGTRPMLDLLNYQRQIVYDEYRHLLSEGFIEKDGLRRSFLVFFANHKKIKTHFPLDAAREHLYRETRIERTAWNANEVRSLAGKFIVSINAVDAAGLATPEFVKVSLSIADALKAATYVPPPAPIDAMNANRNLMEPPELSAADRAVIRAMIFTDSLRHALNSVELSPSTKKTAKDLGLGTAASLIATFISKLTFGI